MTTIIKVEQLYKEYMKIQREDGIKGIVKDLFNRKYEKITAVENVSFDINQGDVVAYIGPNGAGKSTTIKMMTGILEPTSGSVLVKGNIPHKNRKKIAMDIGVVFGQRTQLWWDIPISESFKLIQKMYKVTEKVFNTNINAFREMLDIKDFYNTPVRQLSLGQKMRAELCASLIHNPSILFLDEPTIGLDIVVKDKIREFIKEMNSSKKTTVILTTHDVSDIERLCNRVIVIDKGKKMYDGGLNDITEQYGSNDQLIIEQVNDTLVEEELCMHLGYKVKCSIDKNVIRINYNKNQISSTEILKEVMNMVEIKDFHIKSCEIEEVIKNIYTQSTR